MLRSRRATPIQDIVDGTTTEDRADRRQDHRLRIGATEHLNGKSRTAGNETVSLEPSSAVARAVSKSPSVGSLTCLTRSTTWPIALQLSGILDRGRLGSTGDGQPGRHCWTGA